MNNKWNVLDISVLRSPLLPLSFFLENLLEETNPEEIISFVLGNSAIKEAIYFANPQFIIELEQYSNKNNKKKNNIIATLYKYLSRISTRATPFGLFSGIQEVYFATDSKEIDKQYKKEFEKRIRVDSMWLLGVIKKIEQQEELWAYITVKFSKLVLEEGNRIVFPYRAMYGQFNTYKEQKGAFEFSVKNTTVLQEIREFTTEHISITKLVSKLEELYPDIQREEFSSYIKEIISLEILQSNLRPQLTSINHLDDLLVLFQNMDLIDHPFYIKLFDIKELIKSYSEVQLGEDIGILLLDKIKRSMNEIYESNDFLHIDLKSSEEAYLPKEIKASIYKSIEILSLFLVNFFGSTNLKSYRKEFIEKYGYNSEVNVIELLYSLEFGSPKNYEFPQGRVGEIHNNEQIHNEALKYIEALISEALFNGSEEIVITDEQLNKYKKNHTIKDENLNESFDMLFTIVQNETGFYLNVNNDIMTDSAGQLIGRFAYTLNDRYQDGYKEIGIFEKELYGPDYSIAELSCQSVYGRASNISTTINIRDYEIPIMSSSSNCKEQIDINAILCGVNNNGHFYLKNKNTGKLIIPKTTDMLHGNNYFPNIYRFLLDVEKEGKFPFQTFFYFFYNKNPYTPRIRYKDIILSKRHWNIDKFILNLEDTFTLKEWILSIKTWRNTYNVPNIIEMKQLDSTITFNLNNDLHLEILKKEFLKNRKLQFIELDYGINQEIMSKGIYKEEVTVTILNNSSIKKEYMVPKNNEIAKRKIVPGDGWIYYKLYIKSNNQDNFLTDIIGTSMSDLLKEKKINSFFYVRYEDVYPHIRLRIKTDQSQLAFVFDYMINLTKKLTDSNVLSDITIDTYYPEYSRYGGPELGEIIHSYFFLDSQVSIDLLNYKEKTKESIEKIISHSIYRLLRDMGIDKSEQINLINKYIKNHGLSKKILKRLTHDMDKNLMNECEGELKGILDVRATILRELYTEIETKTNKDRYEYMDDIVLSLVHMNVNRLMVIDREKEHKLMYCLLQALEKN
ncbi:lantibiotic dehydratase [Viridibacillus arvi]|uniref:lantibiotic dehydratase n=1 Tax=Viridibacillus arvi TaxID=263475 RepID=UPI003D2AA461